MGIFTQIRNCNSKLRQEEERQRKKHMELFHYKQNVEITSGFYKGQKGKILTVGRPYKAGVRIEPHGQIQLTDGTKVQVPLENVIPL